MPVRAWKKSENPWRAGGGGVRTSLAVFARCTVRRWWMVWLPSQLVARLYAGLELRLLGEEGLVGGKAQATGGGMPERRTEGMIGRKWREKEEECEEETSIAKKKKKKKEGSRQGSRYLFYLVSPCRAARSGLTQVWHKQEKVRFGWAGTYFWTESGKRTSA